jgi:hypothetical protein
MTLDELLQRIYGLAMTPLPSPPRMDLPAMGSAPDVPALPTVPGWMRRYATERGLESRSGLGLGALLLPQIIPQRPPAYSPQGRQVGSVVYTPSRLLQMQREYEQAGGR